jgi:hypothetical protein
VNVGSTPSPGGHSTELPTPSPAPSPAQPPPSAINEQDVTATTELLRAIIAGKVRPGGEFRPGKYLCQQNSVNEKPPEHRSFALSFYPNNEFRAEFPKDGWASWLKEGTYGAAPGGTLDIRYGDALNMANYANFSQSTLFYVAGKAAAIVANDPVGYGFKTVCVYASAPTLPSPSQKRSDDDAKAEDPETYLQPPSVRAPLPPPGAGGLAGLYWTTRYVNVIGGNGFPMMKPEIFLHYFMKDGHYFFGTPRVSYDRLDCSRVLKDGSPLCGLYRMRNGVIELIGSNETLKYSSRPDGTIAIEGDTFVPRATNLRLEGAFESYAAYVYGGTGVSRSRIFRFFKDGTFYDSLATATLAPAPGATHYADNSRNGHYAINDYTLALRYADDRASTVVFFVNTADSVFINDTLFVAPK